ncbi:AAA family ATPase [Planococcus shixiaomingii]|uniref:AAA family ATPase n=1 Tax=Planococcus shixiaomingii TaxID=3058393 RepID=UPI002638ACA0|nr:AAA family ATPase [Planococcus sp. N022]WKA55512.1 AAA family ATPase [Planococcus sp. N022]
MELQNEIWNWTNRLPNWHSDLLRRLYEKGKLNEVDQSEVIDNILESVGLANRKVSMSKLIKEQIPNKRANSQVKIKSLSNLENISAIDRRSVMDFNTEGLTIIYGDNSAGKSSYARVLKQACRAADNNSKIHPNIYEPQGKVGTVQINIIAEDGVSKTIYREVNTSPEKLTSHFSIFDSECAKIYTEEENDVVFIPTELQIFNLLAIEQNSLRKIITEEKEAMLQTTPDISHINQETAVRRFLDSISHKTFHSDVDEVCRFTLNEQKRLTEIEEDIRVLSHSNPEKHLKELERNISDVSILKESLMDISSKLTKENMEQFISHHDKFLNAKETLEIEKDFAFNKQPLAGVGSNPWMNLWNAAKEFNNIAYPEKKFPNTTENAECLLCQQVLKEESKNRLNNFEEFIQSTFTQEKNRWDKLRKEYITTIKSLPFEEVENASIRKFLNQEDFDLEILIEKFIRSVFKAKSELLKAEENKKVNLLELEKNPLIQINNWIKLNSHELERLRKLSASDGKELLQKERQELLAKQEANKKIEEIYKIVDIRKNEDKYKKAIGLLYTTKITMKYKELSNAYITDNFKEQIKKELKSLRCDNVLFDLKSRGVKGQTKIKLSINSNINPKLKEIFSEGEQKALSLAFFLAEVSSLNHNGGIILDDPVSSFDQGRREYAAKRIIEEAEKRQVIVFTHDIVFLHTLQKLGKLRKTSLSCNVVRRVNQTAGVITKDFPWVAQPINKRIKYLRNELQTMSKKEVEFDPNKYHFEVKTWYSLLREGWERSIEELMFGGVIERFDASIKTLQLKNAKITDDLIQQVQEGMTIASNMVHDESPAIGRLVPSIEEMEDDLLKLESFKNSF